MTNPWQPIDTAPKDGTEIIGFDGDSVDIIHWETNPNELVFNGRPEWQTRDADAFYACYWLPIPPTPEL